MKIRIPDLNGQKQYIENKSSIVLIGANGAGKTRMSVWIDENNPEYPVHRVSAQKSLNMPQIVRPTEISTAEEEFLLFSPNGSHYQNRPPRFCVLSYIQLLFHIPLSPDIASIFHSH